VIYKDKIIAEKYDTGFDKNSRILGWSMTKSITSVGVLENKENLTLMLQLLFLNGQMTNENSTTNDLLHMNSGLNGKRNTILFVMQLKCFFRPKI
jgi:CubicO group peptidase (beta-lactamase class C family)